MMSETEDTDLRRDVIASMQEAVAIIRGEKAAARVHLLPGEVDVRAVHDRLS